MESPDRDKQTGKDGKTDVVFALLSLQYYRARNIYP